MKNVVVILWALFPLMSMASGRVAEPLIIRGKLTNCPEKKLNIFFYDDHHAFSTDTIVLNPDGSFLLKTYRCTRPQRTSIQRNRTQINDIFVAPGYDLVITGDATNFETLFASTRIEGKGSASNQYRSLKGDWVRNHKPDTSWYELSKKGLIRYVKRERHISDSLARIAFSEPAPNDDKYFHLFKRSIELDNMFMSMYYLLAHANMYQLSVAESQELLTHNVDNKLLASINKDEYLLSSEYKNWVVAGEYLQYQIRLDYLKKPELKQDELYPLKKVVDIYSGKVRDFTLYRKLSNGIGSSQSLEALNTLVNLYKPYLSFFTDDVYRKSLAEQFKTREAYLLQTAVNQPAPAFTLKNESDQTYSLADFKGKVVYIDLWASWCKPCREETPFLQTLYDTYKNDSRIAFISIAVADAHQAWLNALKKDKPTWLQLIDSEGKVKAAYNANLIPRFVIINKKGEIVNFDAPRPSDKDQLLKALEREMAL